MLPRVGRLNCGLGLSSLLLSTLFRRSVPHDKLSPRLVLCQMRPHILDSFFSIPSPFPNEVQTYHPSGSPKSGNLVWNSTQEPTRTVPIESAPRLLLLLSSRMDLKDLLFAFNPTSC